MCECMEVLARVCVYSAGVGVSIFFSSFTIFFLTRTFFTTFDGAELVVGIGVVVDDIVELAELYFFTASFFNVDDFIIFFSSEELLGHLGIFFIMSILIFKSFFFSWFKNRGLKYYFFSSTTRRNTYYKLP